MSVVPTGLKDAAFESIDLASLSEEEAAGIRVEVECTAGASSDSTSNAEQWQITAAYNDGLKVRVRKNAPSTAAAIRSQRVASTAAIAAQLALETPRFVDLTDDAPAPAPTSAAASARGTGDWHLPVDLVKCSLVISGDTYDADSEDEGFVSFVNSCGHAVGKAQVLAWIRGRQGADGTAGGDHRHLDASAVAATTTPGKPGGKKSSPADKKSTATAAKSIVSASKSPAPPTPCNGSSGSARRGARVSSPPASSSSTAAVAAKSQVLLDLTGLEHAFECLERESFIEGSRAQQAGLEESVEDTFRRGKESVVEALMAYRNWMEGTHAQAAPRSASTASASSSAAAAVGDTSASAAASRKRSRAASLDTSESVDDSDGDDSDDKASVAGFSNFHYKSAAAAAAVIAASAASSSSGRKSSNVRKLSDASAHSAGSSTVLRSSAAAEARQRVDFALRHDFYVPHARARELLAQLSENLAVNAQRASNGSASRTDASSASSASASTSSSSSSVQVGPSSSSVLDLRSIDAVYWYWRLKRAGEAIPTPAASSLHASSTAASSDDRSDGQLDRPSGGDGSASDLDVGQQGETATHHLLGQPRNSGFLLRCYQTVSPGELPVEPDVNMLARIIGLDDVNIALTGPAAGNGAGSAAAADGDDDDTNIDGSVVAGSDAADGCAGLTLFSPRSGVITHRQREQEVRSNQRALQRMRALRFQLERLRILVDLCRRREKLRRARMASVHAIILQVISIKDHERALAVAIAPSPSSRARRLTTVMNTVHTKAAATGSAAGAGAAAASSSAAGGAGSSAIRSGPPSASELFEYSTSAAATSTAFSSAGRKRPSVMWHTDHLPSPPPLWTSLADAVARLGPPAGAARAASGAVPYSSATGAAGALAGNKSRKKADVEIGDTGSNLRGSGAMLAASPGAVRAGALGSPAAAAMVRPLHHPTPSPGATASADSARKGHKIPRELQGLLPTQFASGATVTVAACHRSAPRPGPGQRVAASPADGDSCIMQ